MTISKRVWENYINGLTQVSDKAKELTLEYLSKHPIDTYEDRQALIAFCYGISAKYGEAAATFACQMYDVEADYEGVILDPAEPAEPADYNEVAKTVNGTLKYLLAAEVTAAAIGRLVKRCGQDTTLKNAIRDGALYAWIPTGDTCPFCLSIAAEGWKKATQKALAGGHAEHIHGNCNCAYAIKHIEETDYAAYNPDVYKEIMSAAEGNTKEEKLNSIRRMAYKENKERINAQKRSVYEKHKELENSEAEEINVN
jgi:hypothetical protein